MQIVCSDYNYNYDSYDHNLLFEILQYLCKNECHYFHICFIICIELSSAIRYTSYSKTRHG